MKRRELAGQRFGKLLVIEPTQQRVRNAVVWRCRCDCGNEIEVTKRRLITGNTRSCGCAKISQMNDLAGKRFGKLTVLSYVGKENGFHIWHCQCDCGKITDVRQSNLQSGRTKSCGCDRNPQKNMHYTEGTCLEMLRPELMYKTNTSGVRGVYYNKKRNKWIAQIMFKQKCYYLGGYDKIEDAAEVRAAAEEKIFGDFLKWYHETKAKES